MPHQTWSLLGRYHFFRHRISPGSRFAHQLADSFEDNRAGTSISPSCHCSTSSRPENGSPASRRAVRLFWTLSVLPSTVLIMYLLIAGKLTLVPAGSYLPVVFLGYAGLNVVKERLWLIPATVVLGSLSLIVLTPELILRAVDYHAESAVFYGGLRPEYRTYFEADSDLMWKFSQGQPGVNSLGFHGHEIDIPKPLNKRRILIIGDSCADQDYASLLEQMLNSSRLSSQGEFECVVLAVPGYSSYQGRVIAERYGRLLNAELAFVCFGWNDHWLAFGATDAEMANAPAAPLVRRLYGSSRLFQLVCESVRGDDRPVEEIVDRLRVPPGQFRKNFLAIKSALTEAGTSTVFVTAPTSHETTGVPTYLVRKQLAIDTMAVLILHRFYAKIVRETACESGAGLLDLERHFNEVERHNGLFTSDGIHFTQDGLQKVAEEMYQYLRDFERLDPTQEDISLLSYDVRKVHHISRFRT